MREEQTERLRKQSNSVQFCSFQRTLNEKLALHSGTVLVFHLISSQESPAAAPPVSESVTVTVTSSTQSFCKWVLFSFLAFQGIHMQAL